MTEQSKTAAAFTIKAKEHYELLRHFDKEFKGRRLDKEPSELWAMKRIYQDGQLNELFLAYRSGYVLGKAIIDQEAMES